VHIFIGSPQESNNFEDGWLTGHIGIGPILSGSPGSKNAHKRLVNSRIMLVGF
jgi:hypothetical protein